MPRRSRARRSGRCRRRTGPGARREALGERGRAAAAMADRLELVDELGDAEQRRHRPERLGAEVLRETGGDDARAAPDERRNGVDDAVVEELHLVDPDCVVAVREPKHLGRRGCGDGAHLRAGMRDDVPDVVAVVDDGASRSGRAARRSRHAAAAGSAPRSCPRTSARTRPRASLRDGVGSGSRRRP